MADMFDRMLDATYRRLGEAATWYPLRGSETAVTVVPERDDAGSGLGEVGLVSNARRLVVRASELSAPSPEKGDRVAWNGARWQVDSVRPSGDLDREWSCVIVEDC